jgi:WD40 repeat protein
MSCELLSPNLSLAWGRDLMPMPWSLKTIIRVVLSFVLVTMIILPAYAAPPTLLWSDPVGTNAIALSADGQYVVVGNFGSVRFYGRSGPVPLWTYPGAIGPDFTSVAISADGSYVAASALGQVYFWANAKSLTGNPLPTWTSAGLGGPIQPRCLAISDDGNYVAACGTGPNVFYWAGATSRSTTSETTTWDYMFVGGLVEAIAISDDGNHVAAVGLIGNPSDGPDGVVGYWNNANSLTGHPQSPTWTGTELHDPLVDVAISNDGNYVVAAGAGVGSFPVSTVYYWAGATSRTGTSELHTWAGGVDVVFSSVDISCDGDSVIAGAGSLLAVIGAGALTTATGAEQLPPTNEVFFWGGARSLTGNPAPTWTHPTTSPVQDVAINDQGTYMAAVDLPFPGTVYFFDRQGNVLWSDLAISGDKLSISCDGGTLAVGTPVFDTAYLLDTGFSSPCTCGLAIPEYPLGLALLAILMVIAYGLIKRRSATKKLA